MQRFASCDLFVIIGSRPKVLITPKYHLKLLDNPFKMYHHDGI